ncbi:c-type cytochrome, partial [Oceanicola sp. S124]|uniref:c-type cytochrome n=1 Tax=Oceanicola sp. S124 TaxID=1042378 RepID=UPI00143C112A
MSLAFAGLASTLAPLQAEPYEAGAFDSYQADLDRGARLYAVGACASCHQDPAAGAGEVPVLAGGMKIDSPNYGLIAVPNITGSAAGIGDWSRADFLNAMLHGRSPEGGDYTPLFPYEFYAGMKPEHVVDLFEYIKAEAPKSDRPSEDHELTLRYMIQRKNPWRYSFEPASYEGAGDSESDPRAWGQYLVESVAACGSCHTPRNSAFILETDKALTGGISVLGEVAGDITRAAIGGIEADDFVAHVTGQGMGLDLSTPMGGSMQRVAAALAEAPDADRLAIYQYLADVEELPKPVIQMECEAPVPLVQAASPDLSAKVDAYFNKECKACHARGGSAAAQATLVSAAKTAGDSALVVPGDPGASALYKSLNRMPTSQAASEADKKLIADWIASLAVNKELLTAEVQEPPRDGSRMFLTPAEEFAEVQRHLIAQDEIDRPFLRYFSFRHMENGQLPCQPMEDFRTQHLAGYVAALNKMVNSLSWEPRITRVEPIHDGATIFAIDLRDYGWTPFMWQVLVSGQIPGLETARPYPYGLNPQAVEADANLRQLAQVTGTNVPLMRGDWFISNAGLPFTYKFMLGLPDDV